MMVDLTTEEREFVIWALHYVAGSSDLLDEEICERAHRIAQKIRHREPAK